MTQKLPGMAWSHPGQAMGQLPHMAGAVLDQRAPRQPARYPSAGMAMRFHVTLDEWGTDLGLWASCRGLQVRFASKEISEGGQYFDTALLPDRLDYSTVILERVMTQEDSPQLQSWLARVAAGWVGNEYDGGLEEYEGQTLTIRLFDAQGRVVTSWVLQNAYPKEWVGPDLSAQSTSVAIERISFEHGGFLQSAPGQGAAGVAR
ncbi:phage tail protein [Streptomyces sp. NPDC088182]|uniref:phage tail protein n=1 Tax=Streptomyces sp. NPDC088182 TaxID=3365838 RepID=UPI0038271E22